MTDAGTSNIVSGQRMQAKDIPDEQFIRAVAVCSVRQAQMWGSKDAWCNRIDVADELGGVPWKVVVAKARTLIKQGRMDGCACGCRGDFDLRGKPDDPFVDRKGVR